MYRVVIVLFVISVTYGCTSTGQKYDERITSEEGLPIHGNFCGPDVPNIISTSRQDRINKLKKTQAIDRIDEACKRHDVCYNEKGFQNGDCDLELIDKINSFSDTTSNTTCMALESAIVRYFQLANNYDEPTTGNIKNVTAGIAAQSANIALSTVQVAQSVAITGYLAVMSPVLLVSGIKP